MIENFLFFLKEGFIGLHRSRLASMVASLTVAISLILIGVFLIITVNLGRVVDNLRSRVELEVFIDDSFDEQTIQQLSQEIGNIDGVSELVFISKEMAISEFKSLFDENQDDYFEVLGFNPLPASFRVKLKPEYQTASGAERVFQRINELEEVNEDDVVYRREFLVLLERYIKIAIAADFLIGTIVCLSGLLLVSNNIRLIIATKQKDIETMKLVGATRLFIQIPLYIQGVLIGLIGGAFSALFLYAVLQIANLEVQGFISVSWQIYVLLISLGVLLGFAGSFTAIRRYL